MGTFESHHTGVPEILEMDIDNRLVAKGGNAADQRDMERMGKDQELRRDYKPQAIWSFTMLLVASWETALGVSTIGLIDGGTAGLLYTYIGVWVAFACIYLSLAEMCSIAPTSGGQYHWVSEFAHPKHQKSLSYIVGCLCVLGWQTAVASTAFLTGTYIQGLLILNYDWYDPQRWHGTLLVIAVLCFVAFFNTYLARQLPLIQALFLILHIFGFVGIIVTLWVLSPRASSTQVWTRFSNPGWNDSGIASLVGVLPAILALLGVDCSAHMAEETKDAARVLPRAMMFTLVVNGLMGLIADITLCYCIGDIDEVISTRTGFAFIQVFYNSTQSLVATNTMVAIVIILSGCCTITMMAASSRQLFAFARDKGLPFHRSLAKISPGWDLPLNAIGFSWLFGAALSVINIGSVVAFDSIASFGTVALALSYIISISCILWSKCTNQTRPPSKFDLGLAASIAINIIALCFLSLFFVLIFFPTAPNPGPATFNWNILLFSSAMMLSAVYYWIRGRKEYAGPVVCVRKLE